MSSREVVFAVSPGPSPEELEAAVDAFEMPDDAWAVALTADTVPEYPTLLVFEGDAREDFAPRAVEHVKKEFGVDVLTCAELEKRFGARHAPKPTDSEVA